MKSLERRRKAALKKIHALNDAWRSGKPGEAGSAKRAALVALRNEGHRELVSVLRERRRLESLRRARLARKWLRRLPKDRVTQILAWMCPSANKLR